LTGFTFTEEDWSRSFPQLKKEQLATLDLLNLYRNVLTEEKLDPKYLSDEWLKNHLPLIIWKLASLERTFPNKLGVPFLTPLRVVSQLKRRYVKEIERGERSILRKIMEKDDVPSRHLVLCVTQLLPSPLPESSTLQIELTDGWYCIRGLLDAFLSEKLKSGKIFIGQKLRIFGARAQGLGTSTSLNRLKESKVKPKIIIQCPGEGVAPLEVDRSDTSTSPALVLTANSVRRAKWDTKLGLQYRLDE